MDWQHILSYITGSVDEELRLRNEYLAAENRILRSKIPGRVPLDDSDRAILAQIGKRLRLKALRNLATRPYLPGTASSSPRSSTAPPIVSPAAPGSRQPGGQLRGTFHGARCPLHHGLPNRRQQDPPCSEPESRSSLGRRKLSAQAFLAPRS